MWSLVFIALLVLGTCIERGLSVPAYGMMGMGAMPYGYGGMGMGYGGMHHGMGMDMGMGMGMGSSGEPELLNCFASFLTQDGRTIANELAVTIEPQMGGDLSMHGGMGMGMGMGMGYGSMGYLDPYQSHGHGDTSGQQLSARIELVSNVAGGTGFVVFTSRARVDDGCKEENFGDIILPRDNQQSGMGHHGMGYGTGLGMGYGMGYGMGFGMGMGHDMGSMFGFDQPEDRGVVTEINITPAALTTAVVEDIGFRNMKDLAGRGVLVCSKISFDWDWNPKCEGPFFSCCNLKYDNKGVGLSGNGDDDD